MNAFVLSLIVLAQCSGGSCPAPALRPAPRIVVRPAEVSPPCGWHTIKTRAEGLVYRVWGFRDTAGNVHFDPNLPINRTGRANALAEASKPAGGSTPRNFGLVPDRIFRDGPERVSASTPEAKRFLARVQELRKARESDPTAQPRGKLHLTAIGSPEATRDVLDDLKTDPELASLADRLLVQTYAADDWAVDPKLGYPAPEAGKAAVLAQERDGSVVYRDSSYSGGPKPLAKQIRAALREPSPDYRPDRDPGPSSGPLGGLATIGAEYLIAGLVLLIALLLPARASRGD